MLSQLQSLTLSKDSKSPVSKNYFMKQNEEKLNNYYQYLLPFINTITNPNQDKKFYTDINKVQIIPKDIDIFTYSFPCQDLSQQGNQLGIQDNTRSGLLLQVKRILKQNQDRLPKTLLMENVKSLTNKKFMSQFED
ncbi:Modification methylase HpaII [Chlamydia trachomatis]|nr:Modification methylase HpaII [Chlamydia trachomatis]